MKEEYIIIYNSECDFIPCDTKELAEREVISLLKEGYTSDDIRVCKVIEQEINVEITEVKVEIE